MKINEKTKKINIEENFDFILEFEKPITTYEIFNEQNQWITFEMDTEKGTILKMYIRDLPKKIKLLNFKFEDINGLQYKLSLFKKSHKWG